MGGKGESECALRSLALNQCTLEGLLLLGTQEDRQCSPTAPQEPVLSLQQGYESTDTTTLPLYGLVNHNNSASSKLAISVSAILIYHD